MLSKKANIRGEWINISLTEEETDNVLNKLIKNNMKEFKRCLNWVVAENNPVLNNISIFEITKMLFEKQATQSFTVLSSALDKKIEDMKKPKTQPIEEEKINSERPTPQEYSNSLIQEAFNRKAQENEQNSPLNEKD